MGWFWADTPKAPAAPAIPHGAGAQQDGRTPPVCAPFLPAVTSV